MSVPIEKYAAHWPWVSPDMSFPVNNTDERLRRARDILDRIPPPIPDYATENLRVRILKTEHESDTPSQQED